MLKLNIAFRCFVLLGLSAVLSSTASAQVRDPFGEDPFSAAQTPQTNLAKADLAKTPKPEIQVSKKASDPKPQENVESWIRQKLENRNSVTTVNVPLMDLVAEIAIKHEIPIVIDERALEEVGLTPDVPVTLSVEDISLRSFLRLALAPFDLTYAVEHEVLMVTTLEHAELIPSVQIYRLPKDLESDGIELIKVIQACVSPDSWQELGGSATIVPIGKTIVVSATEHLHERVADFLNKVDQSLQGTP